MFCISDSRSNTTLLNTPLVLHNMALGTENRHKRTIFSVTYLQRNKKRVKYFRLFPTLVVKVIDYYQIWKCIHVGMRSREQC